MTSTTEREPPDRRGSPLPLDVVLQGDCLPILEGLPSESVDLIYVDPPFGTGQVQRLQSIRLGVGDKTRKGFGDRTHRFEVQSDHQYRDDMPLDEYLVFLEQRLREAR